MTVGTISIKSILGHDSRLLSAHMYSDRCRYDCSAAQYRILRGVFHVTNISTSALHLGASRHFAPDPNMRRTTSIVIFSLLFCAFSVVARDDPNTITLPVVIHDFFPCASDQWVNDPPNKKKNLMVMDNCNHDIQPHETSKSGWGWGQTKANKGMVKPYLDKNRKPIYAMKNVEQTSPEFQTKGKADFDRWDVVL